MAAVAVVATAAAGATAEVAGSTGIERRGAHFARRGALFRRHTSMTRSKASQLRALELAVDAAGVAWAAGFADALGKEGRAVAGGWPGTLSEARARVSQCAAGRVTPDELDQLTRRAYDAAKREWLERAGPTPDDTAE